ncbi:hypothetical protein AB205_0179270 [Aquarana catesbeiana]|uniref:Cytochrome c oxidase subunit 5A, mitochondrial n=1 Tax=Aquarana catesbeiana TaxID=8400 RepID=A0A2G9R626_AQUCT|nr:hypothetical protein AB205_0179270 [Aquarana catesbeiana]
MRPYSGDYSRSTGNSTVVRRSQELGSCVFCLRDNIYVLFFLHTGINTLIGYDLVPEPKIIDAALRACRRLNDFASSVRILEAVKDKAGPHKEIYPYVIQELRPTLDELGISTPEELGLDKA